MNYTKPKQLLTTNNSKTIKGTKYGYTTYIMYLAPYTQNSLGINLCSHASKGCAKACLFSSGAARFPKVQEGKINKTEYFLADRKLFLEQLDAEITKIESIHNSMTDEVVYKSNGDVLRNKKFAIRLNGTADIRFEKFKIRDGKNIFELHPGVQFYDYTKNHYRFTVDLPSNYHLTFSRSEDNDAKSFEMLKKGFNVAMVFGVKSTDDLPSHYRGFKVINGDKSDLRFLDEDNVIVGLKYKLMTGKGTSGSNKDNVENNDFIINMDVETASNDILNSMFELTS
jgi:hypothetical protein